MYQFAEKCPRVFRMASLSLTLVAFSSLAVHAETPGEPVLTIDGAVAAEGGALHLDMAALQEMRQVSFSTATSWTDGVSTFTGVALRDLLDAAGAEGTEVHAVALNSFSAVIPVDSIEPDSPIVAYAIDGAPFPRRDKGPLWIVYPFDKSEAYRNEVVYGRSVWQLRTLSVK